MVDVVLRRPERLAGRDPELVGDQVAAGHRLGHRVFDLEPGVHLEEGRFAALGDEELARAGTDVADLGREGEGRRCQPGAQLGRDRGRRRLLEDLLVPPLERAVPLAEVDAMPVGIEQDLDLDVARAVGQALEDEPVVAEGRQGLTSSGSERVGQAGRVADRVHALATAPGRGLDEERVADPSCGVRETRVGLVPAVVPGEDRHAESFGQDPGRGLVAHRSDRRRRRADPAQPGGLDGLGEVGVLGEEAEARVDRVGTRSPGGADDDGDVEEVDRVGPLRGGSDGADAESFARALDANGDLAAIGDEEASDRPTGRVHRPFDGRAFGLGPFDERV